MDMSCGKVAALYSALYDDDLEQGQRRSVLDHLADCDECRTDYRHYQSALGALAGMGDENLGPEFDLRVQDLVEKSRVPVVLAMARCAAGFGQSDKREARDPP